jgi:hypothetical protein
MKYLGCNFEEIQNNKFSYEPEKIYREQQGPSTQ